LVTAYSTKGDALRGAARRVSMVFGRLLILRADGTVEEDRRYPARKILPTDRDAGHAGCSKPRQ
jgi:hypothetical protein